MRQLFLDLFWRVRYKHGMDELTTSQAAARLSVGASTVRLWCQQGRFPNARAEDTPRGTVWLIPEGDLRGFEKPPRGRIPKSIGETSGRATGGAPTGKKKGAEERRRNAVVDGLLSDRKAAQDSERAAKKGGKK